MKLNKAIFLRALVGSYLLAAYPAIAQEGGASSAVTAQAVTLAERQAAWNANKAEYRRRVAKDGQKSADRWLDQQVIAARGGQNAVTTNKSRSAKGGTKSKRDCKKVRWVNRATPGFGGSGMTMSRVPVCAD